METLVLKFGGAAVAQAESFASIAAIIAQRKACYKNIVVVASAMGGATDHLIELAHKVHPSPPRRELDMLISAGERISIALLSMALHRKGLQALSFTGSQSGIITNDNHTDAEVIDVRPQRLLSHLAEGKIVIVAGFQGVSRKGEITTLGRGGSDLTAVALAASLHARKVEFYKDVSGICTDDPKTTKDTRVLPLLNYEEAIALIDEKKAKVLHPRSLRLAKKNQVPLHVVSFYEAQNDLSPIEFEKIGTWIRCNCLDASRKSPVYEISE